MLDYFKRRRRQRLRAEPFPAEWRQIIERNVAVFQQLPLGDQTELLGHVQVLLDEKHFEGCGGLELTDEIRVTVAAQASVLLLRREPTYYPRLTSILIYPSTYVVPSERADDGLWEDRDEALLGHTGRTLGALVLAWDATLRGARNFHDGDNVVFHEFAHQLDFEDDAVDGTPLLQSRTQYVSWARVLGADFEELRRASDDSRATFLDQYGATNPAEFFAVATEFFFERPRELRERHAALYAELRSFYRQDPAEWPKA
jgi:MtfA peptidase